MTAASTWSLVTRIAARGSRIIELGRRGDDELESADYVLVDATRGAPLRGKLERVADSVRPGARLIVTGIPSVTAARALRDAGFEPLRSYRCHGSPVQPRFGAWLRNDLTPRAIRGAASEEAVVARPLPRPVDPATLSVSVVIPCKDEAGNVAAAVKRMPRLGRATELLFCDDRSTDGTADAVRRAAAGNPELDVRLLTGPGQGKAANVRTGFNAATGDVLAILDGDLTVPPELLPEFVAELASGRAELVNGSRLVLPMAEGAMPLANRLGNVAFARVCSRALGQRVTDTLCGTKVFWRRDWPRLRRSAGQWGGVDRWGDFDLLFGAAEWHRVVADLPLCYQARVSGITKMTSRFGNGLAMGRLCATALVHLRAFGAAPPP